MTGGTCNCSATTASLPSTSSSQHTANLPSLTACRTTFEYKFFVKGPEGDVYSWQPGMNLKLDVPKEDVAMEVLDKWDGMILSHVCLFIP